MVATKTSQVRIAKAVIRNFKGIELEELDLKGKNLIVSGPNGAGKTSIVEAMLLSLGILTEKEVGECVRHGADAAELHFELRDDTGALAYMIDRRLGAKGKVWSIRGPDGNELRPSKDLEGIISERGTNPASFLRLKPQQQADELLRVYGVVPPVERVKEITGENHPARDGESASTYLERLSADQTGAYYVRRRDAHQVRSQKKAALEDTVRNLESMPPATAPDLKDLFKRREELEQGRLARAHADAEVGRVRSELDARKRQLTDLEAQEKRAADEIADMERRLEEKRKEHAVLSARILRGRDVVELLAQKAARAENEAAKIPDPSQALAELGRQFAAADQERAKASAREAAAAQVARLREEFEHANDAHARLDGIVNDLRALRANLLNDADLGIAGLQVVDGVIRLNGVSFGSAGTGERLDVACAVSARGNPKATIMIIDDGQDFDRAHREQLFARCAKYGWQFILTLVRDDGPLAFDLRER